MTYWEIQADEFASCNCAYGCPCQFNALPTHGNCEAVAGYLIERGHFGNVPLDGLRVIGVMAWPGAVHEGRGRSLWIIDERASEAQREALLTILNGGETDPGATVWNVFASTMEERFEPLYKAIEIKIDIDARQGRLSVEGLVRSEGVPIRNPVTGDEHRVRIDLPEGFEYRLAEVGSATFKTEGPIPLAHQDSYAQFARIHLDNHGVVG
ncbi:MAG: DUF1326 domain-containing protein [Betaproteobacteria bacterium]|jgi:hypothetical protein|nr:MAG: DUF1326 domain-containing protein [Betaproteobacteria bacterium]